MSGFITIFLLNLVTFASLKHIPNMCLREYYQRYEEKIGDIFAKYGKLVTNYPWIIMIACVIINGLLVKLTRKRKGYLACFMITQKTNFNPYTLSNLGVYGEVVMKSLNGENVLKEEYLDELLRIDDYIKSRVMVENGTSDNQTFKYDTLCAKKKGECSINGQIALMPVFRLILQHNVTKYLQYKDPQFKYVFGNVTTNNGTLTSATVVKLRYNLRQDTEFLSFSKKWELNFIKELNKFESNITELSYAYSESLNHELNDNTKGDIKFFSFTFVLMMIYASFVTSGGNCLSQRQNLGRAGVLSTGLSILSSFGLMALIGVKFVNIVGVMPFLVLGIGIDDMFILMSGASDHCSAGTILMRTKNTLRTAGVSITITSLTDFLAFAVGSTSVFLRVAVVMCYINQLTFFMPCMVIHERRIQAKRHAFTCQPIKTGEELRKEGKNCCFICCCSGSPPNSREEIESLFEKFPKILFQKLVLFTPVKILIVLLFIVYTAASIYGTINLQQGLVLRDLVIEDSHFYKYSQWDWDYFPTEIPVAYIIDDPDLEYSDIKLQNKIEDLIKTIQSVPYIQPDFQISWLQDYKGSSFYKNTTENDFVIGLKDFLKTRVDLQGDVVFQDNKNRIKASRVHVITPSMKESTTQGEMMVRTRELADTSDLQVFAFSPPFIYFEQYNTVLSNTIQTVGIAVAAMVIVTTVFMPHPLLVFFVTITMIMIMFGVFGFMYFWGLTLSSITMIHIVMSVGFSVDFSAHICHAYVSVSGKDRNSRVSAALARSGAPVFNAAASSIIGIMMLAFSKSYVFQSFFKLMLLVILFGLAHSMLLLPVVLSWIGPNSKKSIDLSSADTNGNNDQAYTSYVNLNNGSKKLEGNRNFTGISIDITNHTTKANGSISYTTDVNDSSNNNTESNSNGTVNITYNSIKDRTSNSISNGTNGVTINTINNITNGIINNNKDITNDTNSITNDTNCITNLTQSITNDTEGIKNKACDITNDTNDITNENKSITNDINCITNDPKSITHKTNEITNNSYGITNDTNGFTKDSNGITKDTNGITNDSNGITKDTNGITKDTYCITNGSNSITNGTNGVTSDTYGITNGITDDTNGITNDTNDITDDTNDITNDANGITYNTNEDTNVITADTDNGFTLDTCVNARDSRCDIVHVTSYDVRL
ncbi:hypothetical protein KUTeg_018328 [Tegillarca granosa]|uniref:SSD domain-containing protein n=1 Tax=Tegillarca granosa TaxID=220873 RepID=A0ABQ9EHT9_TEGGR|nr:hypothetical protein KUTeg_018328 [Tegillarca granosa]